MSSPFDGRPRAIASLSLLLVVGAALPSPVSAGEIEPGISMEVELGFGCVSGSDATGDSVAVTVRMPNGALRGQETVQVSGGDWQACGYSSGSLTFVSPGDRVEIRSGQASHALRIPRFMVDVDRVADTVSGSGPRNAHLRIKVVHERGYSKQTQEHLVSVQTAADGSFSGHVPEIKGRDKVSVRWRSGNDTVTAVAAAPFMTLRTNDQTVQGAAQIGTRVRIKVVAPGDKVRIVRGSLTTDSIAFGGGVFIGSLTAPSEPGRLVYPKPGDLVLGSFASDAEFEIPQMQLHADPVADTITGRCLPRRPYRIRVTHPDTLNGTDVIGAAAADGTFHAEVDAFNLRAGDTLQLACLTPAGDEIGRGGLVR